MTEPFLSTIVYDPMEAWERLAEDRVIGVDIETTGLSPWKDKIAIIQFYGASSETTAVIQCRNGRVPNRIKALFSDGRQMVAHNAVSFDILFLDQAGVPWRDCTWYDTLVGETVVIGTGRSDVKVGLAPTVKRRLGITLNKEIDHGGWTEWPLPEDKLRYATGDVILLPRLMAAQVERAVETHQMNAMRLEQRLVPMFAQISLNGLPMNPDILSDYLESQQDLADRLQPQITDVLGNINMNSPKQLKAAFAQQGVMLKNTARETLVDYVNRRADHWETVDLLLQFRAPAQRLKMYGGLWAEKYITAGRVHPRFWPCGADTGRTTSSDPNLQQVPRDARWLIGGLPGHQIIWSDYSQIEVVVAAFIANETNLIKLLEEDDVHRAIAAQVFGVPPEEITAEQRKLSKAVTFTMLFAGGVSTIHHYANMFGATLEYADAEHLFTAFLTRFPAIAAERRKATALAANRGPVFIRLLNGLRRGLVGDKLRPSVIVNTKVQGNAAIGLKLGMLVAEDRGLLPYIGATVHDELVACVPDREAEEYGRELRKAMIDGMQQIIPLTIKAEALMSPYWGGTAEYPPRSIE